MRNIKVLIDNGHGENTPGKCSPDRSLLEYKYTREIAQRVCRELISKGVDAILLTPETTDISITERVRRANAWCSRLGSQNVVLISIHNNAAGNGGWYTARGWLSIIDDSASLNSKKLADILFDEVKSRGLKVRQPVPNRKWYLYGEALGKKGKRLGILKNTRCPAVLTENFFQDNKEDVKFLLSEEGKELITSIHVDAVLKYLV